MRRGCAVSEGGKRGEVLGGGSIPGLEAVI